MATFAFDERYAKECGGSDPAVFINRLIYWLRENRANNRHFHDGHWWSYNTYEELSDIFTWLNEQQIRRMIKKLETDKVILVGHYAKNGNPNSPPSRTNWYAFVDESKYLDDNPSVENESSNDEPPKNDRKSLVELPSVENEGRNGAAGNSHPSKTNDEMDSSVKNEGSTCAGINAVENLAVKNLKKAPLPPEESKNSKTASSVPEVERPKPNPKTNQPDPNNPHFFVHKRIAMAAYEQMGRGVLPSNPQFGQLMGVIADCADCWSLEQQADLLPKVIQLMQDRGEEIRFLHGFLKYKGRGNADEHPYGEVLARERPDPDAVEQEEVSPEVAGMIDEVFAGKVVGRIEPVTRAERKANAKNIDLETIHERLGSKKKHKRKRMTDEERRAMMLRIDPGDGVQPEPAVRQEAVAS